MVSSDFSSGEFLAPGGSIEDQAKKTGKARARVVAPAPDRANGKLLEANKSPSRKVGELDNRGTHFYLALYWAEALAEQTDDKELQRKFSLLAKQLRDDEAKIVEELHRPEGNPVDIGGYYHPNPDMAARAMRPSPTFNAILQQKEN